MYRYITHLLEIEIREQRNGQVEFADWKMRVVYVPIIGDPLDVSVCML